MIYLGVDPGQSGGISALNEHGTVVFCRSMPVERIGKTETIREILSTYGSQAVALVEKVGPMPGQGVTSMFNFGYEYGCILQCLADFDIQIQQKVPRSWQKICGVKPRAKSEKQRDFKIRLLSVAKKRFPYLDVWGWTKAGQLSVSDSLLLAYCCRRLHADLFARH